jgi:SPOR domain
LLKTSHIQIIVILLSLSFTGCASSSAFQEAPRIVQLGHADVDSVPDRIETGTIPLVFDNLKNQFRVDVFSWGGDDWEEVWNITLPKPHVYKIPAISKDIVAQADTTEDGNARIIKTKRGYRVQLANVTEEASAKNIQRRAKSLFKNIYMTFNSPNYKVRGGDFLKRSDADEAAKEAKLMGFRSAWVVPDKINIYK